MRDREPYLLVRSPEGKDSRSDLQRTRITVGRLAPGVRPDVVLEPDPQQWVGRVHCVLELVDGAWTVNDNATVNGTFLQRGAAISKVVGQIRLQHGDVILLLGDITDRTPRYWSLRLVDPFTTRPAPVGEIPALSARSSLIEYDWVAARIFRVRGTERVEIADIPPTAHKLIRFMIDKNQRNGGTAVVCSHEQIRRALWGEPEEWPHDRAYTDQDVRDVIYQARRRIEARPRSPELLETVRGLGYRLRS